MTRAIPTSVSAATLVDDLATPKLSKIPATEIRTEDQVLIKFYSVSQSPTDIDCIGVGMIAVG